MRKVKSLRTTTIFCPKSNASKWGQKAELLLCPTTLCYFSFLEIVFRLLHLFSTIIFLFLLLIFVYWCLRFHPIFFFCLYFGFFLNSFLSLVPLFWLIFWAFYFYKLANLASFCRGSIDDAPCSVLLS